MASDTGVHYPAGRFDAGCASLMLTIRRGPKAGLTIVDCTCGWKKFYKSRRKAEKRYAEHLQHSTPPAPTIH